MSDEQQTVEDGELPSGELGATEILRGAFVDDGDPRFPLWLPIPAILVTAGWAFYDAIAASGDFLPTLLWPGIAIFIGTIIATWLGWQLDID
jgi:hypothetical protein